MKNILRVLFAYLIVLNFCFINTNSYAADPKAKRISFTPAGTITATDVQAAIEEVATEGAGGAPTDAEYVVLSLDGDLSDERVLTEGEAIDIADGGANGNIVVSGEDASDSNKGVASFTARDFSVSSGAVSSTKGDFYNGTFAESFNALVTSNGTVVTLTVTNPAGGNLTSQFSSGNSVFTGGSTIALTVGASDAAPQKNFIYVLESAPATLVKSTTEFPTNVEHIRVGFFFVPTAAYAQADGIYINQNWNDHLVNGNDQGHLAHLGERIRLGGADGYFSGLSGNGDGGTYVTRTDAAPDTVYLETSAGVLYQFHRQAILAKDTSPGNDDFHVVNSSVAAYEDGHDLYDFLVDADGDPMNVNPARYYNLVLWMVGNKTSEYAPLMVNLPTCSYSTQSGAELDSLGCDVYSLPREFVIDSNTGHLLARLTMKWTNSGSDLELISTVDLRGTQPTVVTGGGGSSHDPVSLAGTPDYLTLSGQILTLTKLDIADDLNVFSSANLFGLLSDETGSASGTPLAVFNTNPVLTGATLAGILADNDDMVFEIDADNNGSNKYSFTDGASAEIASLTEAGALATSSTITATGSFIIGGADLNETDLEKLDGITNGTVAANKAVIADGSLDVSAINDLGITTSITTSTPKTITVAELDRLDGLAGIIVTDATAVTDLEGRSLTIGGATLAADAELYTDDVKAWIETPAVEAMNNLLCGFANDITITFVKCITDAGTVELNLEDGSDNNILSAELVCDTGGQTSCASGCDVDTINTDYDNITARTEDIDLDISAVATATELSLMVEYTIDD